MLTFIRSKTVIKTINWNGQKRPSIRPTTIGLYRCSCGKFRWLTPGIAKLYKSCGCRKGRFLHGHARNSETLPLYTIWGNMRARCYCPSNSMFHCYGGKGIRVCDEWRNDFVNFFNWAIANGWRPNERHERLSIERRDNNKDYEPSNCCFIPLSLQGRNRYTNKLTMKKVRTIRACYNAGLATKAELARRYNITRTHMSQIVLNRLWKEDK